MIFWIANTLVASTLLMVGVLALRTPVRRILGQSGAYALWAIPALRMVLPPLHTRYWTVGTDALHRVPSAQFVLPKAVWVSVGLQPTAVVGLVAIWICGAAVLFSYHLLSHSRFRATVQGQAVGKGVLAGRVRVMRSDFVQGPLAFGVWQRRIILPSDFFCRYIKKERKFILAHEIAHHKRGDLMANWAALIILCFHWFNPVAWISFQAFRKDQEFSCDESVLLSQFANRKYYASAIVKSASVVSTAVASPLRSFDHLKGRLEMLNGHHLKYRGRRAWAATNIAALAALGLTATASGGQGAVVSSEITSKQLDSALVVTSQDCGANDKKSSFIQGTESRTVILCRDHIEAYSWPTTDDDIAPGRRQELINAIDAARKNKKAESSI